MENKLKKRSINTVIYFLLGAMLMSIIGVSIYTVASRRKPADPVDSTTQDTTGIAEESRADTTSSQKKESKETSSSVSSDETKPQAKDTKTAVTTAEEVPTSVELRYFVLPVNGSISKDFEIDIPVYSLTMNDYRAHVGVDLASSIGDDVVSASSGTVCRIWNDPLMGKALTIDHGAGIYTTYKNLAEELAVGIEVGTGVSMGQVIGSVGESALIEIAEEPHLHFEMQIDGAYVNPLEYISADAGSDERYEY